jgi:3-oxoadipate enol-lactonase
MTPVREQSIETSRGRMAWLEAGEGWPVVLLHAFPLSAAMWRPQLEAVPSGWRLIAPDLRGFGAGPPLVERQVTMDEYALDVIALMDALEIDESAIGGLSMGGYVTFALFRQAPARFTAMVLADTRSQADTPAGREARLQMRTLLAEQGPRGVAGQMLPKLLSPEAPSGVVKTVRAMIESADARAIDAAIGALMDRVDSTPDLARINVPALVTAGEGEALTPVADSEAMQRAIARSTLVVIPGAGHLANLEQPGPFSRALADFLESAL